MRFAPRRPKNGPKNDDERVLPLINVVFLLLIFFMLAGKLAATDPFQIAPPRSLSDGPPAAQDSIILVGADGRLALDGVVLEEPAFKAALAERLAEGAGTRVQLKADGRAEAARVVAVMELLREAGVKRLKLLTVPVGG